MALETPPPSPPRLNRRERSKAQTRQRVISAARELFLQFGYETVTIKMIADKAGVAVGSVFTTMPSKSSVLQAIVLEALNDQLALVDSVIAEDKDVVARLARVFHALYAFHETNPSLVQHSMSHAWLRDPEAETAVREGMAPLMRRVEEVLRGACARGELAADADLRLITDTLFLCYFGAFRRAGYDGWGVEELAGRMEQHIRLVLGGAGLRN